MPVLLVASRLAPVHANKIQRIASSNGHIYVIDTIGLQFNVVDRHGLGSGWIRAERSWFRQVEPAHLFRTVTGRCPGTASASYFYHLIDSWVIMARTVGGCPTDADFDSGPNDRERFESRGDVCLRQHCAYPIASSYRASLRTWPNAIGGRARLQSQPASLGRYPARLSAQCYPSISLPLVDGEAVRVPHSSTAADMDSARPEQGHTRRRGCPPLRPGPGAGRHQNGHLRARPRLQLKS